MLQSASSYKLFSVMRRRSQDFQLGGGGLKLKTFYLTAETDPEKFGGGGCRLELSEC